jgi:hypothetical protein
MKILVCGSASSIWNVIMATAELRDLKPYFDETGLALPVQPQALHKMATALQSLLAQTEQLLSACRLMLDGGGSASLDADDHLGGASNTTPATDKVARITRANPGKAAAQAAPNTVDVDMLEIFRSRFPELSGGPLVVLSTLILNSGRIVTHAELRAALNTKSVATTKVYISRIRKVFEQHNIDSKISTVRGGYGISRDFVEKTVSALGLTEAAVTAISGMYMRDTGAAATRG